MKRRKKVDDDMPPDIREALKRFPEVVRQKRVRYLKRQKFLRETFGPMVRLIRREERLGRRG